SVYLAEACGSDMVLRQRVDALLSGHRASESFLETPAISMLALAHSADDLSGRTVGSYRLLCRIGAGAMGEVYQAHDENLDRRVAVKLIANHLACESR